MDPFSLPDFDPIALQIGPLAIRWYALAYVAGLVAGWRYGMWIARRSPALVAAKDVDDFLVWAILGVILGGRLGYVIFYQPSYFLENPLLIPQMWHGGMSFHGGLLGVIVAMALFARRRGLEYFAFADIMAAVTPIGLFFGRIANFINGELWGRPTDVPWAVIFPSGGPVPRHPSQLYEAALEGLVLFVAVSVAVHACGARRRPGMTTGIFLVGYALARIVSELFREPDDFIGSLAFGTTWGQWLSLPMLLFGAWLIWRAQRRPAVADAGPAGSRGSV